MVLSSYRKGVILVKKDELVNALNKAKIEINDKLEAYIHAIESGTADPNNYITISKIENIWKTLALETHKTYSDLVGASLSAIDTSEVNDAKKDNSSRMG